MLILPDIHDVYTPLQTDVIVPLSEVSHLNCRPSIVSANPFGLQEPLLSYILVSHVDSVPSTFGTIIGKYSNYVSE